MTDVGGAAVGTDSTALRQAVGAAGIRTHLQQLQQIAAANGDTRASGTPGYNASADYVEGKLKAAGYSVARQNFTFPFFQELSSAVFERISPSPRTYASGADFLTMEYSGSGDVTAAVQVVDIVLPPGAQPSTSNSGCDAADFAGFTPGRVALIQRGTCTFAQKAQNAAAAGAVAAVIFNEGQEGRTDTINGTLGGPGVAIPVLGTSFAVGEELAGPAGATVRIKTNTLSQNRQTANIIAESAAGRTDRVVVIGAHLDSVPEGPGINDNGSGTAVILEIASQLTKLGVVPRNKLRFAFWGAEESGLLGAEHYVGGLSKTDIQNIALNLNFDMLGSPNYVRFVYDGDGSSTPQAGPNGSSVIEDVFLDYFRSQNLASEPTAFDGRSDYGPFIDAGIPAGGLFSGAEGAKKPMEAQIYGGTAGAAYDPCYHQACDDISNLNDRSLEELGDATAHAVLQFAMTTSAVKGTSRANDRAVKRVPAETLTYRGPHLRK